MREHCAISRVRRGVNDRLQAYAVVVVVRLRSKAFPLLECQVRATSSGIQFWCVWWDGRREDIYPARKQGIEDI